MTDKFIYVFNESDRDALLSHGYILLQEPKSKKTTAKKKSAKDKEEPEETQETRYWVFENKSTRDLVFNNLDTYLFSNVLTF